MKPIYRSIENSIFTDVRYKLSNLLSEPSKIYEPLWDYIFDEIRQINRNLSVIITHNASKKWIY